ncbi:MAG: chromate efflux transporter [Candidatus Acidiferrales bacterium]
MTETEKIVPSMTRGALREVLHVFLKVGTLAFGGAAGQIAMMRREVVERRRWISEQDFLDLFGIMNLIPGPSATETVIALGYWRAGWPALVFGGPLFILPAILTILVLAWVYVRFGSLPAVQWVLYGVNPVVIAIIADALWSLGRTAIKTVWLFLLGAAALVLYFLGVSVVMIVLSTAVLFGAIGLAETWKKRQYAAFPPLAGLTAASAAGATAAAIPFTFTRLFLTFMKIGAVSYGSGYVLLAFLHHDFVRHLHWLTEKQLLDAIAAGQITPGPVFATATFIGYATGGFKGAMLATLGMFLPSFIFVAILFPLIPKLKGSAAARTFLDGINAATMGLMAAVSWQLARGAIVDIFTAIEGVIAFFILMRYKINAAWLILAGIATGCAVKFMMH